MKGNDGFNYYDDTKERVLPGVKAPPPKRETPKIADTMRLADEWQEATKPVRDLARQRDLMTIGLEAAAAGNMVAGSQAVLVTFPENPRSHQRRQGIRVRPKLVRSRSHREGEGRVYEAQRRAAPV